MDRRSLLKSGIAVSACAAFGGLALYGHDLYRYAGVVRKRLGRSAKVRIVEELASSFPGYDINSSICSIFVERYHEVFGKWPSLPVSDSVKVRFLLSTNFVQVRGERTSKIKYVAFYDPYVTPCYNPFLMG